MIYAGVEPAALFRSDDGGRTFELVEGLWEHPHRRQWQPGGGGLCLHTVLVHPTDPQRLLIAISAAGVYRSDDGGAWWQAGNRGIVVGFVPEGDELEFGQCVHKVARDAGDPERLYLQHHGGIYRSDDGGASWAPMTGIGGMDFGFPVVAHPRDPSTAYLLPLASDEYRCTPEGHCIVWRTTDAGTSWQPLTNGLPQCDAHLTVLRDGFTTDGQDPAGLYFGTRTGEVYASTDAGDTWRLIAEHLPPVIVGPRRPGRRRRCRIRCRWGVMDVRVRVPRSCATWSAACTWSGSVSTRRAGDPSPWRTSSTGSPPSTRRWSGGSATSRAGRASTSTCSSAPTTSATAAAWRP